MHEMSIASSLIEQVLELVEQNNASKVTTVSLEVGQMRRIVPDFMETAWQSVTAETVADESVLEIDEIGIKARCNKCGLEFECELDNYLCPKCVCADVDILQGNEIILTSVDMEIQSPEVK